MHISGAHNSGPRGGLSIAHNTTGGGPAPATTATTHSKTNNLSLSLSLCVCVCGHLLFSAGRRICRYSFICVSSHHLHKTKDKTRSGARVRERDHSCRDASWLVLAGSALGTASSLSSSRFVCLVWMDVAPPKLGGGHTQKKRAAVRSNSICTTRPKGCCCCHRQHTHFRHNL